MTRMFSSDGSSNSMFQCAIRGRCALGRFARTGWDVLSGGDFDFTSLVP